MMIETGVERVLKSKARVLGFMLVALIVLFLVLATGKPAQGRPSIANTFTVNSTGDQADANLEDSLCDVDLAATGNQCTLRAAIEEANDTPNGTFNGIPVNDVIRFNIAGTGVNTIQPLSALPAITDPVSIDGYTQPGASANTLAQGNDAVLKVVLNGTDAEAANGLADGLTIQAPNSTVRGLVINSFGGEGILITGSGATNNAVRGNFIGTDATGMQDQGNSGSGVEVSGASNNTIGGTRPAERNVISGHKVFAGVSLGFNATGNAVQGNYVGTNAAGTAAIPNSRGIQVSSNSNNTIGGTTAGARNIISGNSGTGIELSGSENLIQGNFIGTDVTGQGDLGNGGTGVAVFSTSGLEIGGTQAGAGNLIAFNGENRGDSGHGVVVANSEGNASILSNSIHSNAGLGIELGGDGITVNDPDDPDTGPNNFQNFPIIASTTTTDGSTTIEATLDSTPSTTFTVQFFARPAGPDDGNTFLGEKAVTTDANGDAAFSFTTAQAVPAGQEVTATATSPTGDTSEFYQFLENKTFVVNSTADPGDGVCDENECTLREAIRAANKNPLKNTIEFDIPGDGVHTIAPTSILQLINRQVVIDGYTQPGASPNTQAKGSNAVLKIELSGENVGPGSAGLSLNHPNSVVRGLVINRFSNEGLNIDGGGVKVEGNFIGTDATGTTALGNGIGVYAEEGDNTIGGASPAARNVISGNELEGVYLDYDENNKVQGNLIGTKKDGTGNLGNGSAGVYVYETLNSTIGGTTAASANTIAFNDGAGVEVSFTEGHRILQNSIFNNTGLGIDLGEDGPTANDDKDPDTGANNLQNFPVITSAKSFTTATTIRGRLNSTPGQVFRVRFFSNPSGTNEGKTFLGQIIVTTGPDGLATFVFKPARRVALGQAITATATDPEGNTSEFSAPRSVVAG